MAKEYFNLPLKELILRWTVMEGSVGIKWDGGARRQL
jgi:hypothetical protein